QYGRDVPARIGVGARGRFVLNGQAHSFPWADVALPVGSDPKRVARNLFSALHVAQRRADRHGDLPGTAASGAAGVLFEFKAAYQTGCSFTKDLSRLALALSHSGPGTRGFFFALV